MIDYMVLQAENCLKWLQKVECVLLSTMASVNCLAVFLAIARYVTLGNVSCDLSRNGVARPSTKIACQVFLTQGQMIMCLSRVVD